MADRAPVAVAAVPPRRRTSDRGAGAYAQPPPPPPPDEFDDEYGAPPPPPPDALPPTLRVLVATWNLGNSEPDGEWLRLLLAGCRGRDRRARCGAATSAPVASPRSPRRPLA